MSDGLAERLQTSLGDAFTVERELGGGGMARVFLARDRALDRSVVIKALDIEGGASASAERFRREIQVIARLQHPHIVPVLTAGGTGTLLWYAMPYVSGESLRARLLREGALPLDVTLRITREVLDALGYAHAQGFVHRDVKPENILLEAGHAVVADFGVAKALADAGVSGALTSAGLALGTPTYMAPEQAMADPTTNHRADLYAVGAVMYETLVGAPPYSGNAQAVIAAHLTAPVPRVEERRGDVPASVAQLIAALLAKNPAERPQTAADALRTLETVTTPSGTAVGVATPAAGATPSLAQRAATGARTAGAAAIGGLVDGPAGEALKGIVSGDLKKGSRGRLVRNIAFAVLLAGSIWFWKARKAGSPVVDGADVIAVMPLGTSGDSVLARLGRDLVVTLSTNLDGVGVLRTVDAMSVLRRTQKVSQLSLTDAQSLAGELGARSVVHGALVAEGASVRADLALYRIGSSAAIVRASATAPPGEIRALTDSLTWQLLRGVWRRGTAPSPLFANIATGSIEALRAFLDGEALFGRVDIDGAMAAYRRATEADSNFVQAYLRLDWLRSWSLSPPDTVVRARLHALNDRLPAMERAFNDAVPADSPFVVRLAAYRAFADRYPDYQPGLYRAADAIIHTGPLYGIPITESRPYLARLDALAPDHADNVFHLMIVAIATDDTAEIRRRSDQGARLAPGAWGVFFQSTKRALAARSTGRGALSADSVLAGWASVAEVARQAPTFRWIGFLFPAWGGTPADARNGVVRARTDQRLSEYAASLDLADGTFAAARGEYREAIHLLDNAATAGAPEAVARAATRVAAVAAWTGGLDPAAADSALSRLRARNVTMNAAGTLEVAWLDGLIGIMRNDSARVARIATSASDTSRIGRNTARSLRALWSEHRGRGIDSVLALDDDVIRSGGGMTTWLPVHRLLIGRELVRRGETAKAERYLQWPDAAVNTVSSVMTQVSFAPLNAYQRGLAFESAGDKRRATIQYRRFVAAVDRPPPAFTAQVADATARLAKLTGDVRK